jgi:hypothetical protein
MRHYIKFRDFTKTIALVVIIISLLTLAVVQAAPPPSSPAIPFSGYGVVAVFSSEVNSGSENIATVKVTSNGGGEFFVVKLLIFMSVAQESDLILNSLGVDGFYSINFDQYNLEPKIVVIASGSTIGDVVGSLQTSQQNVGTALSLLLLKDPLGNQAIVVNGGPGNGLTVGLTFASETTGAQISAEAIVTAPTNNTITIALS